MSDAVSVELAKTIMSGSFIGPAELRKIGPMDLVVPETDLEVPFSKEVLLQRKKDYILVYGVSKFADGEPVTIRNLLRSFGNDPEISEPCFYNQDWYINEKFIDVPMRDGWFLIRENVYEEGRKKQPETLVDEYSFPTAIACAYAFFCCWLSLGRKLWYHDFVWCSDVDHNGDRIYVGKYNDVDGINKNGFSIHRHLALRDCYSCVDCL